MEKIKEEIREQREMLRREIEELKKEAREREEVWREENKKLKKESKLLDERVKELEKRREDKGTEGGEGGREWGRKGKIKDVKNRIEMKQKKKRRWNIIMKEMMVKDLHFHFHGNKRKEEKGYGGHSKRDRGECQNGGSKQNKRN